MGAFDDLVPASGGTFDDLVSAATQEEAPFNWQEEAIRQLGLTARAAGPVLGGAAAGAALGSVVPGVGTALGAGAGAAAGGVASMLDQAFGLGAGETLMDTLKLPKPATSQERIAGQTVSALGGVPVALGGGRLLAQAVSPVAQRVGQFLQAQPVTQASLSGLGGIAGGVAAESGSNAEGQALASIGAPLAATTLATIPRNLGGRVAQLLDTALRAEGPKRAAGRVITDAAKERASAIPPLLRAAETPETAAAAAVPAGSAEFAGLERMAAQRLPSVYGAEGEIASQQKEAMKRMWEELRTGTAPLREAELQAANARGVTVLPVIGEIDALLQTPAYAGSKTARNVLNAYKTELQGIADAAGNVDANALYSTRKELGNTLESLAKREGWDKTVTKGLVKQLQKSIDAELGGGSVSPGWKDYLKTFSTGAKRIEGIEERAKSASRMGTAGEAEARRIFSTDELPITLPNLLSRPVMTVNALARFLEGRGGLKTSVELARLLRPENKAELARVIEEELARRGQRIPLEERLGRAGVSGAYAGSVE